MFWLNKYFWPNQRLLAGHRWTFCAPSLFSLNKFTRPASFIWTERCMLIVRFKRKELITFNLCSKTGQCLKSFIRLKLPIYFVTHSPKTSPSFFLSWTKFFDPKMKGNLPSCVRTVVHVKATFSFSWRCLTIKTFVTQCSGTFTEKTHRSDSNFSTVNPKMLALGSKFI